MIVQCPECGRSYRLDDSYGERPGVVIKCPGCQTRFSLGAPPERPQPPDPSPSAQGPPAQQHAVAKILVADDSSYFRTMVGDMLTEAGFTVCFAGDGREALEKIRGESPDLVILDLHLPGISGFDVIKDVRHGTANREVPILVMSSVFTETSHVMALETLGANDFIDKKFKPDYLVRRVKRLLPAK